MKNKLKRTTATPKAPPLVWITLAIAMCLLIVLVVVTTTKTNVNTITRVDPVIPFTKTSKPPGLNTATDAFFKDKPMPHWLLDGSDSKPLTLGSYEKRLIKSENIHLHQTLLKNSTIPEVAELNKLYGPIMRTCIADMIEMVPLCINPPHQGDMVISLYPEVVRRTGKMQSLIMYRYGSVFVPLLANQDPVWYDARFLHELLHAKQDHDGSAGAHAPPGSLAFVKDEVAAHSLARKVLDVGTSGEYSVIVADVAGHKEGKDIRVVAANLTGDDFSRIDSLFTQASSDEVRNRAAQYILDILHYWIQQQHYPEAQTAALEVNAYRMLVSP